MGTAKLEIGQPVILSGFAFEPSRKEKRVVERVHITPSFKLGGHEIPAFVRIKISGEPGWFTSNGDKIPVGPGELRFSRVR